MEQKPRSLKRKRGIMLSVKGWHRLQEALKQWAIKTNKKRPCTLEDLNEITGLCANTLIKVRDRKFPVDRKTLEKYFQAFNLKLNSSDFLQPEYSDFNDYQQIMPIKEDWNEAMDTEIFYGRTKELRTLEQWIVQDKCRLIPILGMGGMGKTALAIELAKKIKNRFQFVIWHSLGNGMTLDNLLKEIIGFLSNEKDREVKIGCLLKYLRKYRCLLILDNLDSILAPKKRGGKYRSGYENYGDLFKILGQTKHNSCLLLTSREKPAFFASLEGMESSVRSFFVKGSLEASLGTISGTKLFGSEVQKLSLCKLYAYNPLQIKIISTPIQDLFDGNIELFLAKNTAVFDGIKELLEQQFERLEALEKIIMYWLAVNRNYTNIEELEKDIIPFISPSQLLEVLTSLRCRSLIKISSGSYTQEPLIMEYVTAKITEQITTELLEQKICLFARLALLKTNVSDWVEESQIKLILDPIAKTILTNLGSISAVEKHFQGILDLLRDKKNKLVGYAPGNLINLANHLQIDLKSFNFSGLSIWQAHLKDDNFNEINLTHCDLKLSVFTR